MCLIKLEYFCCIYAYFNGLNKIAPFWDKDHAILLPKCKSQLPGMENERLGWSTGILLLLSRAWKIHLSQRTGKSPCTKVCLNILYHRLLLVTLKITVNERPVKDFYFSNYCECIFTRPLCSQFRKETFPTITWLIFILLNAKPMYSESSVILGTWNRSNLPEKHIDTTEIPGSQFPLVVRI